MNKLAHAAGRKVFSGVADYIVSQASKSREDAYVKFLDTAEKYMARHRDGCKLGLSPGNGKQSGIHTEPLY